MNAVDDENLFRRQAIESLKRKSPGRAIGLAPRPWLWFNILVVALCGSAAIFLSTFEYARRESVRGWVIANPDVVRITASVPAKIRDVVHAPGDHVEHGRPLVYLSADAVLPAGYRKNEQLLLQLRKDVAELDGQLASTAKRDQLDGRSLESQLRDFDVEVNALQIQVEEQQRLLRLGRDKLQRVEKAASKGAVTEWESLQEQQALTALALELSGLRQEMFGGQRERERLRNRVHSMPLQSNIERSSLRLRRSALLQQIAEIEARRMWILTSPVSGTVSSVLASAGNSAAVEQLLMTIIPDNVKLSADIYVPSRAAGFLRKGQSVRLTYDAFPKQTFGVFEGEIEHISQYVLMPGDVPTTFSIREATYKVHVELGGTDIGADDGTATLRPGMLLVAEIVLEERSLFDWFVETIA